MTKPNTTRSRPRRTGAEAKFKAIVRGLVGRGIYPTASVINAERHAEDRHLNGRELRWRRQVCNELGVAMRTLHVLVSDAIPTEYKPGAAVPTSTVRVDQSGEPSSPGQRKAFLVKASTIERTNKFAYGSERKAALELAGETFGREVSEFEELTWNEAHWLLDEMQKKLDTVPV